MKSFKGLTALVQEKNEKIRSKVRKKPSAVFILNSILYTSAASGLYWSPYLID